jgi:CelD/BcsL family acetyltransferase involved in cellulose biosynthesis
MSTVSEYTADEFMRFCGESSAMSDLCDLVRRSGETNVFFEEWMLLPALRCVRRQSDVRLVCVRGKDSRLIALFPFELVRHTRFKSLPVLRSWRHDYCFLSTPLVDPDHAIESARALGHWVESGMAPAGILEFHTFAMDGRFGRIFIPALTERPGWVSDAGAAQRALLKCEAHAKSGLSAKHLKELRRIERRLAELGRVRYTALKLNEDFQPWLDRFLALETRSWKGAAGTALGSKDADEAFFRSVALQAHRRSRLQLLALELNDAPIAMKCNFLAPPGSFAFKITYDEKYRRYSPGVLLELFNIDHMSTVSPEIAWMDSCADPGHPMIERLWSDRITIGWCSLCGRGILPRAIVAAAPRYRHIKRAIRRFGSWFPVASA